MAQMDTVDGAPDQAEEADAHDRFLAFIEEQPLTSLIIAFFAGLIVGRCVL